MQKTHNEPQDNHDDILKELRALRKDILKTSDLYNLKRRFITSMVGGFGTVIGATLLVSLLVIVLRQFATINVLEPIVKNVITIVDKQEK